MNFRLMSEKDATTLLSISAKSIRKLRQCGDLPYIRIGGVIRYDSQDLTKFIDERRMQCASTNARAPLIGGSMSPSKVSDIEAARRKRAKERQK